MLHLLIALESVASPHGASMQLSLSGQRYSCTMCIVLNVVLAAWMLFVTIVVLSHCKSRQSYSARCDRYGHLPRRRRLVTSMEHLSVLC